MKRFCTMACLAMILFYITSLDFAEPSAAALKWSEADYDTTTIANFRKNPLFLETLDFDHIDYPRIHAAIFFVTNEIRVKNRLSELAYSPNLEIAAFNHSMHMAQRGFFSHQDGSDRQRYSPGDRAKLAGITNPSIAENIAEAFAIQYAAGKPVYPMAATGEFSYAYNGRPIPPHMYLSFADEVLKMWMNSSGHRANILSKNNVELGCGVFFYRDKSFYNMPMFKATQNFQWYQEIVPGTPSDPGVPQLGEN